MDTHDPGRFVSAAEVLQGNVAGETFERKLAIIAVTGLGLVDNQATPSGERMPGAEIHAQVLESIFDGTTLLRVRWSAVAEAAALAAIGLLVVAAFARLGPAVALPLAAGSIATLAGAGAFLYRSEGLLFDAASPVAGVALVSGYLFLGTFFEAQRQRQALKRELAAQRVAAARIAGEMDAARRIQTGMLPLPEEVFPGETRFEIAVAMRPAREVGGDLYDFFLLDDDRLFLLIGDVAGKGLPASLFMAVAKALVKSAALRGDGDIGALGAQANAEICRDNPELLFVTAIFAVFDLRTWQIDLLVAGHEPPYRIDAQGSVERLRAEGGPPLCALEDYPYPTERVGLAPDEALVFFTDGITEAMDDTGALFGRDRLEAALSGAGSNRAARLVEAVRDAVKGFVGGAEASDDFTLLAVRRTAPAVSAR